MNRLPGLTVLPVVFVGVSALAAGDWPAWRGPNRDNISHETGLLHEWPEDGPPLKWQVEGLGAGTDSVSIANGRICTLSFRDDIEYVTALDQETGMLVWESPLGEAAELANPLMRWLTQRSPTIDVDRLFVVSTAGDLVCLRLDDGAELWHRSYSADFGAERPLFGYSDCPFADGEQVIGTPCGSEATIVALHRESGDVVWQSSIPDVTAGYGSTVLSEAAGIRQYVVHLTGGLISVAANDGRLLWRYGDGPVNAPNQALTPIVDSDTVIAFPRTGGAQNGRVRLKVTQREGKFRAEEQAASSVARINAFQDCPVLLQENLYLFDRGIAACYPFDGEKPVWQVRLPRESTGEGRQWYSGFFGVTCADGLLFVRGADDAVRIVEATPDEYREHGHFVLPSPTPSTGATQPVLSGGHLYIRDETRLFCYDVRATTDSTAPTRSVTVLIGDAEPASPPASRGHWPQWRGPNRDNHSSDTDLLAAWPEEGPPLEWRVEGLGEGIASVSLAGGRIFTVGYIDNEEYLTALDERTGARLWATHIGQAVGESRLMRWLSQRCPTVDDNRLYVLTAQGELICLQAEGGRILWRKSYPRDFDGRKGVWGYCDYPLVDGEKLICTPGGTEAMVVALDRDSGETIWKSAIPGGGTVAYAAVVAAELGGVSQYVVSLREGLVGVAADDGRALWHYDRLNNDQNSYTPLVLGNHVLCASGRQNAGIALLDFPAAGDGMRFEEQYYQPLPLNHFQDSLVRVDQSLYANTRAGIVCLSWSTGETLWTAPPPSLATRRSGRLMQAIVAADGHLYVRQSDGTMLLVESSPEAYVEQGSFSIPDHEPSIGATFPVITGGRMYLRDNDRLFCYDVRRNRPNAGSPRTIVLSPPAVPRPVAADAPRRVPRPIFVPTPQDVVSRMLEVAKVQKDNLVVDLGSGDGRIVIAAAKEYGCRAIGFEIDKELVEISRKRIEAEQLAQLATIEAQDMYTADLSQVDVVAVYVYPSVLEKMKPQFQKLKPGARIVSHYFEIPGIEPTQVIELESQETGNKHKILLYEAPLKAAQAE